MTLSSGCRAHLRDALTTKRRAEVDAHVVGVDGAAVGVRRPEVERARARARRRVARQRRRMPLRAAPPPTSVPSARPPESRQARDQRGCAVRAPRPDRRRTQRRSEQAGQRERRRRTRAAPAPAAAQPLWMHPKPSGYHSAMSAPRGTLDQARASTPPQRRAHRAVRARARARRRRARASAGSAPAARRPARAPAPQAARTGTAAPPRRRPPRPPARPRCAAPGAAVGRSPRPRGPPAHDSKVLNGLVAAASAGLRCSRCSRMLEADPTEST